MTPLQKVRTKEFDPRIVSALIDSGATVTDNLYPWAFNVECLRLQFLEHEEGMLGPHPIRINGLTVISVRSVGSCQSNPGRVGDGPLQGLGMAGEILSGSRRYHPRLIPCSVLAARNGSIIETRRRTQLAPHV
jgi:hypothetical protein